MCDRDETVRRLPGAIAIAIAIVAGATLVAATPAAAATDGSLPGLFVLPVSTDRWSGRDEARLFEARLLTALARGRRVRPLAARDIPPRDRPGLPDDLATCVSPDCIKTLARAGGAARVLAPELIENGWGTVLFVTLYDGATGDVIDRRELPRPASAATRQWAAEVARWAPRAPTAPPEGSDEPPAPAGPVAPLLSLHIAPEQGAQPEAQALLAALGRRLRARSGPCPGPALATDPRAPAGATHRATIAIERVAITERLHHVHHYRRGVLAAELSIAEMPGGFVVFRQRADADLSARRDASSNPQILDELADRVVWGWLSALCESPLQPTMPRSPQP